MEYSQPWRAQSRGDLLVPRSGVGPEQDRAACPGLAHARDQLVERSAARRAAYSRGRYACDAHVQDLVGVGACRDDRVISQLAGIAVAGTALVVAWTSPTNLSTSTFAGAVV